jgi:hypothetical protein
MVMERRVPKNLRQVVRGIQTKLSWLSPNQLAQRLALVEEGLHQVGADDGHRPRRLHVFAHQVAPGHQLAHGADAAEVLGHAHHAHVHLAVAPVLDGAAGGQEGAHLLAGRAGLAHGLHVQQGEVLALHHLHPLLAAGDDLGHLLHGEGAAAQLQHLLGHVAVEPLGDGYDGDDRGHPDQDAQHGQERAQLAGAQRRERDARRFSEGHEGASLLPPLV